MPPDAVFRCLLVFDDKNPLFTTYKVAKRIVIGVVGGSVLVVGVAMIVLPGPAFVVIPLGLGILSLEFAWARNWLRRVKQRARAVAGGFRRTPPPAD
jgi:tellurite resistance protein TerC